MKSFNHVDGKDCGKIVFYGLSTCVWCKKARHLLDELGVAYDYVYVDLLDGEEQERAMVEVRRWNPNESFPTLVFNESNCVLGFDENGIRRSVGQ
jgi:glutaredoxin-like protein NrdH